MLSESVLNRLSKCWRDMHSGSLAKPLLPPQPQVHARGDDLQQLCGRLLLKLEEGIDRRLDSLERSTGERFERVFDYMGAHEAPSQKTLFEGQAYDAFGLLVSLVQRARREIVLIDGYVDTGTPNILAKKQPGVSATVWTPARRASRSPSLRTPPSLARLSPRLGK